MDEKKKIPSFCNLALVVNAGYLVGILMTTY